LAGRELVRKLCLRLGLLQPGDSRDVIVDVLLILLQGRKDSKGLSLEEVKKGCEDLRGASGLDLKGLADSNLRRQLKRLKDLFLVEKVSNGYRISEFSELERIFEEKIEKFYLSDIVGRVKGYLKEVGNL